MTTPSANTDSKSLARIISIVENESKGYEEILFSLKPDETIPVIGITGAPGAGKSSLINALLKELISNEEKYIKGRGIAVLAVDPTSPFSHGALLGDRLRMSEHFNHPKVFIRSLATRGSLGGLSSKTMEITDVLRSSGFDYIFMEIADIFVVNKSDRDGADNIIKNIKAALHLRTATDWDVPVLKTIASQSE